MGSGVPYLNVSSYSWLDWLIEIILWYCLQSDDASSDTISYNRQIMNFEEDEFAEEPDAVSIMYPF